MSVECSNPIFLLIFDKIVHWNLIRRVFSSLEIRYFNQFEQFTCNMRNNNYISDLKINPQLRVHEFAFINFGIGTSGSIIKNEERAKKQTIF